ncbi:sulfatase-like hydrolase/transferase [Novosphingobium beihaiensis]|uniref:LTA synthase family protein n=1 Tax=Novosphingobium beihaiensis TaxID=2930389 RepID=A0ABT0BPR3_9SPHN|nr:sulfatase-like hydrolase/transferase [Novosphingobium beihaiensis]MCJ2187039.1 LTA synthase family protein [Novosphingobium beihaiensis]
MLTKAGRWPIAPLALPVLVAFPLWSANFTRISYGMVLPAVLTVIALTIALFGLLWFATRQAARASLITTVWLAVVLYAPSLISSASTNHWILVTGSVLALLLAFGVSRRISRENDSQIRRANGLINLMMGVPAFMIVGSLCFMQYTIEQGRPEPDTIFPRFPGRATTKSPDVWHFVMDRYAGTETLANRFGYDNRPFLDALRKRGFAVAEHAYSNYQVTPLSLASTLNASYLDRYTSQLGSDVDIVPMFRAIDHNAAFDFFKRQGYQITFAGGWADVTAHSALADRTITFRPLGEFPRTLMEQSIPGVFGKALGLPYADGRKDQCLRVKYKFKHLREIVKEPQRKYVFAHFLIPHPPYALTNDGSCQSIAEARRIGRSKSYVAQVEYANSQLLHLIDAILAAPRPATIIIQADEGPYPPKYAIDEPAFDVKLPTDSDYLNDTADIRREKTGIILAIRHGDGKSDSMPRSPVNIYPAITNHSFGTHIPFKEDKTLMFGWTPNYKELRDVSAETFGMTPDKGR